LKGRDRDLFQGPIMHNDRLGKWRNASVRMANNPAQIRSGSFSKRPARHRDTSLLNKLLVCCSLSLSLSLRPTLSLFFVSSILFLNHLPRFL